MIKKVFFFSILFLILFLYSLSYVRTFYLSVYSIVFFALLGTQLVFSRKNKFLEKKKILDPKNDISERFVDVLVVGYREDPEYWKKCLQSISVQDFPRERMNICISIDGDEREDVYMFDESIQQIPYSVVIMNKHGGKRSAIIHGYEYLLKTENRSDFVILIDSDTILEKSAITNLVKCINTDDTIGCATGNIKIFNRVNFLTKIIDSRYAYAFNIERSYLSYFDVMNCCSGPLSIYRKSLITREFIEKFRNQTMFGNKIEPGDDRHQTLLVLAKGFKSKMSPFSICWTESPEKFERFLRQQLRWMRSFYREQYWQFKCLKNQPFFLSLITIYEILFPFFITFWVIFLLYFKSASVSLLIKSFLISVIVATIKTIFLVFETRKFKNICNFFYLFIYFLFLLPTKIYALLTLLNNNWKTSSRFSLSYNFSLDTYCMYACVLAWNVLLIFGVLQICL